MNICTERKITGIKAAASRLTELGEYDEEYAFSLSRVKISDENRRALGKEGAAATLRSWEVFRSSEHTEEELLRVIEDLETNPWDRGALRDAVEYQLWNYLEAFSNLDYPDRDIELKELEERVSFEMRVVGSVADYICRENNKIELEARIRG